MPPDPHISCPDRPKVTQAVPLTGHVVTVSGPLDLVGIRNKG
jgi:hypothetical protein